MKKIILNMKIFLTNIARVIYSFLFINVGMIFTKLFKVEALSLSDMETEVTCYFAGPPEPTLTEKISEFIGIDFSNIFFLLVPIALVIFIFVYLYMKRKDKEKEKNKDVNKEN